MSMQIIATDQFGVTYANPQDPDFQIRFKTTSARKSVDGISMQNYVSEVIITDNHKKDATAPNEALSVRLRTSGSTENKDRLYKLIKFLAQNLDQFETDSVFYGFRPSVAPVVPA